MKALFRLLSFLFLAAAIYVGVLDSIRSVSTSTINTLSARAAWEEMLPASLAMTQSTIAVYTHPEAWRWIELGLSAVPAFALLLILSLLFWMAGYRKPRIAGRFSA